MLMLYIHGYVRNCKTVLLSKFCEMPDSEKFVPLNLTNICMRKYFKKLINIRSYAKFVQ